MDDLLKVVSFLSLEFQKDSATCLDFLDAFQSATLDLLQLRQTPGNQLQGFLDSIEHDIMNNKNMYKNIELTSYAQFDYQPYQSIIDIVIDRIAGRLENPNDPTKDILQATQIFDTCDWQRDRQDLAVYGTEQLQVILFVFHNLALDFYKPQQHNM